ncbi:MAG: FAD-dependent thymidylate synthase [Firmicutes bacterium]|nr:FAD-dependent thymidylate synthase [Bacillota bacterium]
MLGNPGKVRLLAHTPDIQRLIGAASRLVTTQARGKDLWSKAQDHDSNERLVRKLVSMGHLSVIEHATVTLSFEDVSLLAEQFVIQFRLASFTVKSRRYVDFSSSGYYIPAAVMRSGLGEQFCRHADWLFDCYSRLQASGVPREDARFVLPYCLRSNFICTMNLRELCHLVSRALSVPWSEYDEIRAIGSSIRGYLLGIAPFLDGTDVFEPQSALLLDEHCAYSETAVSYDLQKAPECGEAGVELISYTPDPDAVVAAAVAAQLRSEGTAAPLIDELSTGELVDLAADGRWARNLEHAVFTFAVRGLSLAGLTHLTRHRMQSLCIPDLGKTDLTARFVLPDSIRSSSASEAIYVEAASAARRLQHQMSLAGIGSRDRVYLGLCGSLVDVILSMNARELLHFIALRTCNRAQWEIRSVARAILSIVRTVAPYIFNGAGPNCVRSGRCPEGKLSCGRAAEMIEKYG